MKTQLNKIWKDPVFSNVISVGVIGLITIVINFLYAITNKLSFKETFIKFLRYKFELWIILVLLIIFIMIFSLLKEKKFKYDEETLKLDKEFYHNLKNKYLTQEMMLEPKSNTFSSNPFISESLLSIIYILQEESKKPDFEFINPHLNRLKDDLINEIENLSSITSRYIFGTNNSGWLSIPSEWEYSNPELFQKAKDSIYIQENVLTEKYEELIKQGRRIFKI